jgi:hypothetical protein
MVPEFPDTEHLLRYPAGDAEALVRIVTASYEKKQERSRLVQNRSWDRWAEHHHQLFVRLLQERGLEAPKPAPGFRFGLLDELEVPMGVEVDSLEAAVDRAAAHLFYGRYHAARAALEEVVPQYCCVRKLLETIPQENNTVGRRRDISPRAHVRAIR